MRLVNSSRRSNDKRKSAFTLIELIVVIAIIVLLVVVLGGVLIRIFGSRGISMARNSIDGYLNGLRLEAINRGTPILVVLVKPENGDPLSERDLVVADERDARDSITVTPGFYAFFVDREAPRSDPVYRRIRYMNRDLVFVDEFYQEVTLSQDMASPDLPDDFEKVGVTISDLKDLKVIGSAGSIQQSGAYVILIRPDGRAIIPGDVPGFVMEQAKAEEADGDIVVVDQENVLLIDISPHLKVRSRLMRGDEAERSPFNPKAGSE